MEKKIKQLTFIIGAIIAVAIAALPLSSFAAQSASINGNHVSLVVNSILTFQISTASLDLNISPNMVRSGDFTTTVKSSQGYSLSLNGKDGDTNLTNSSDASIKIPGGNCTVVDNGSAIVDSCWNVKVSAGEAAFTSYHSVPSAITLVRNGSANTTTGETTTITVGIAANPTLAPGSYSGTLVVTASGN